MKKIMILLLFAILILSGCGGASSQLPEATTEMTETIPQITETSLPAATEEPQLLGQLISPKSSDFVRVTDYIPEIMVELKYSGTDNFIGQDIYEFDDAYLRYGTVMKLKAVSEELAQQGLRLKIWDAFRPVSAQFKLWEICPDDTYVANPNVGYSNHSRGFAVDVTLVDEAGREVEMPTAFDDFSGKADRDYSDCTAEAAGNAMLLESVLEKHGLAGYRGEWWHFNDTQRYEVESCFDPAAVSRRYLTADAPLLERHWMEGSEILTVPAGEPVTLLGFDGEYAMADYWGYRGYVRSALLQEE